MVKRKPRKRQTEAEKAASKALRATKAKALRYAKKLEKQGFHEAARELNQTAGAIWAEGRRSYGQMAKDAAKEARQQMARASKVMESQAIFNAEMRSFVAGSPSSLTKGLGISRLEKMKARPYEKTVRQVDRLGRATSESVVMADRQEEAMKIRAQMMASVFFQKNKSSWESGPYSDRATSIALASGKTSAAAAWQSFWREDDNRAIAHFIDYMARQYAVHGKTGDEVMDGLFAGQSIIGSPTVQHIIQEAKRWAEQRGQR